MQRMVVFVVAMLSIMTWLGSASISCGQDTAAVSNEPAETQPKPITTRNIRISLAELTVMVKPLTAAELEVEADAWMKLLRAKAKEIAAAQLGVRMTNEAIKAADTDAARAEEKIKAIGEVVEKAAAEATEEKIAAGADPDSDTKPEPEPKGEDEDREAPGDGDPGDVDKSDVAGDTNVAPTGTDVAGESQDQLPSSDDETKVASEEESSVDASSAIKEAAGETKQQLLDQLADLRAQQTALIDRLDVVLNSWEAKGGEVESYRKYMNAVGGLDVDVSDANEIWSTVKGWALSEEGGQRLLWNVVKFVAVIILTGLIARILAGSLRRVSARAMKRMSRLAQDALVKALKTSVWIVGIVVALTMLEVNITPMLAAIGAAGLVIGLALQGTLSNIASGVMILINRPFDEGDVVNAAGITAKVTKMTLVATIFRTFDNQTIVVPNNSIWGQVITNVTANSTRRVDMVFGVAYEDDLDSATRILEEIVKAHELVLDDPQAVIKVNELGDSSVNLICRPWCRTEDYWTVFWDVTRQVKDRFDAEGVSIPFPQRNVYVNYAEGVEPKSV